MRYPTRALLTLALLAFTSAETPAQHVAGTRVTPRVAANASLPSLPWQYDVRITPHPAIATFTPQRRARAGPYVALGALAGALATAGAMAYYFGTHPDEECICPIWVFAVPVAGGAAVGAATG